MKYLGEQICAECDDEYGESAEYGLFAAELLAEPARGDGGDCGGGGKGGGHDGCLSGGLMKNLIRKQSEEGGDGICAAEEEEQTHEHEDKASSLAGGELLFLSRFFFGLCGLFFSLASCLCVGCLIHLALYLNAAVGLLDEEEDDETRQQAANNDDEEKEQEKNQFVKQVAEQKYEFGFTTDVHTEIIEKGLNEDVVRLISQKKGEPDWMLEFRLKAYNYWKTLKEPKWGHVHVPPIDYQEISYYADPLAKKPKNKEIDPELEKTFDKLGIPLEERLALSGTAVDAIMDSVSVKTTFKEKLREKGVIFCSIGEAVKEHPDLVREYLGTVVPYRDNFYAALNSCVFSDGSFVYIPKGVRCPMELSSYFRINARNTGQFERTLIIADDDAYVSYLEGCTAPMRDENQLHAAIVEIIVKDNAEVKYSTVQNWYPGDEHGKGGVLNLVTKRGDLRGVNSKLSWTQVETGSAITWKYPSCILRGDNSVAEFYSVAVTNNYQEADTGTKMIHMGKNTKSTIISKGISAGHSQNSYRGLVRATSNADNARNYSSCDSLLLGSDCGAHTFPYMDAHNDTAVFEHEATTSKISEDQLFYCNQRGIPTEEAVGLIVNGYAKDVLNKLPMEFAVEAQKLLSVSLEGTVG